MLKTASAAPDEQHDREDGDGEPQLPEAIWRGPFAEYRAAMDGVSEAADVVHFVALWVAAAVRLRRRIWFNYAYPLFPNVYAIVLGTTGDAKKTTGMRQQSGLLPAAGVKVLHGVGSGEALADWMQQSDETSPVSHLVVLEEFAALMARARWDGSSLLAFLTQAFDAPAVIDIPFRKNPIHVVEPTPSLQAGSTPEWFWKVTRDDDITGGAINRVFLGAAAPKAPIPLPRRPHPAPFARVVAALDQLADVIPTELYLQPDTEMVWSQFYLPWKTVLRNVDPLTAALGKRADVYAMKLAMIYAAFEKTLPFITPDQMTAATMIAGYKMDVDQWLVNQRRTPSVQGDCEEAVCRALKHVDLPRWKIHQVIGARRWNADQIERAIKALLAGGIIVVVRQTARDTDVYGLRARRRDP